MSMVVPYWIYTLSSILGGVPDLSHDIVPLVVDARLEAHLEEFNERIMTQPLPPETDEVVVETTKQWFDEMERDFGRLQTVSMLTQVMIADTDEPLMKSQLMKSLSLALSFANFYEGILAPSREEILKSVAPHYPPDLSGANTFMTHALLQLAVGDRNEYRWSTNFEPVKSVLQDAWDDGVHTYDGLVDFMFDWHAILAMMAMHELEGMDAEDVESLFQQVRVVAFPYKGRFRIIDDVSSVDSQRLDEAEMILRKLSKDDSLWARVFVAEVLSTVPDLRDPEIEAALREDPHWLIQRRMAYLDEEVDAAEE